MVTTHQNVAVIVMMIDNCKGKWVHRCLGHCGKEIVRLIYSKEIFSHLLQSSHSPFSDTYLFHLEFPFHNSYQETVMWQKNTQLNIRQLGFEFGAPLFIISDLR